MWFPWLPSLFFSSGSVLLFTVGFFHLCNLVFSLVFIVKDGNVCTSISGIWLHHLRLRCRRPGQPVLACPHAFLPTTPFGSHQAKAKLFPHTSSGIPRGISRGLEFFLLPCDSWVACGKSCALGVHFENNYWMLNYQYGHEVWAWGGSVISSTSYWLLFAWSCLENYVLWCNAQWVSSRS